MLPLPPATPIIDSIVDIALTEDLASGDLTTEACVPASRQGKAFMVARQDAIACGLFVAKRVFERLDADIKVEALVVEGTFVSAKTVLLKAQGPARALLMAERAALNFVQRMMGIATLTSQYVAAVPPGSRARIVDTRKTTPGLRALERYAVRAGGGINHRDALGCAVLIKDNHIVACGGVGRAVQAAKQGAPHSAKIECEVESQSQLDEALRAGADIVLLDNMDNEQIARSVEKIRREFPSVLIEVSGGITLPRIASLSQLGVDIISSGALTHSVPAADVALDLTLS